MEPSNVTNIEVNQPHKLSMVICLKCFKRWVCVRPEITKLIDLECSNCGSGYVIETGEEVERERIRGYN